ncbi:hypothetical protein [Pseudomonas phage SRT6]|nr:hypothetical protein [Pseudomonas phage SRT6]
MSLIVGHFNILHASLIRLRDEVGESELGSASSVTLVAAIDICLLRWLYILQDAHSISNVFVYFRLWTAGCMNRHDQSLAKLFAKLHSLDSRIFFSIPLNHITASQEFKDRVVHRDHGIHFNVDCQITSLILTSFDYALPATNKRQIKAVSVRMGLHIVDTHHSG